MNWQYFREEILPARTILLAAVLGAVAIACCRIFYAISGSNYHLDDFYVGFWTYLVGLIFAAIVVITAASPRPFRVYHVPLLALTTYSLPTLAGWLATLVTTHVVHPAAAVLLKPLGMVGSVPGVSGGAGVMLTWLVGGAILTVLIVSSIAVAFFVGALRLLSSPTRIRSEACLAIVTAALLLTPGIYGTAVRNLVHGDPGKIETRFTIANHAVVVPRAYVYAWHHKYLTPSDPRSKLLDVQYVGISIDELLKGEPPAARTQRNFRLLVEEKARVENKRFDHPLSLARQQVPDGSPIYIPAGNGFIAQFPETPDLIYRFWHLGRAVTEAEARERVPIFVQRFVRKP